MSAGTFADDRDAHGPEGDTAVPDIYMRARWLKTAAAAAWAPRYMENGFAVADVAPALLAELRAALRAALDDEHALEPELFTSANAYRNAVAMPARWITEPPDGRAPPSRSSVSVVYGEALARLLGATLEAARPVVEQAVGTALRPTAWHGPRVYGPGSVLVGHTDEYPMHAIGVSLTLEADQAWDMQFLDLSAAGDGVTRQAATGENCLVIYEGCRVLHARMRPYAGRRYIGAYLHYAPVDYASSPAVSHPRFWLPGSPSGLPEA